MLACEKRCTGKLLPALTLTRSTKAELVNFVPLRLTDGEAHPLMNAAVVHYAAHRPSPALGSKEDLQFRRRAQHYAQACLAAISSVPPTREIVCACLVLAYSPGGVSLTESSSRTDPFGASLRAFTSVHELGYLDSVFYLQSKPDWTAPGAAQHVENMEMARRRRLAVH